MNAYGSAHFVWNYMDILITTTGTLSGPDKQDWHGTLPSRWSKASAGPWLYPYTGPTQTFTGAASGQIGFLASTASAARIQPTPLTSANIDPTTPNKATKMVNPAFNPALGQDPTSGGYPVGVLFPPDLADPAPQISLNTPTTGIDQSNATVTGTRTTQNLWGGIVCVNNSTLTFTLEYQDPVDGTWRPYSRFAKFLNMGEGDRLHSNYRDATWNTPYYGALGGTRQRLDPRTDRFSASEGLTASGSNQLLNVSALPHAGGGATSAHWPKETGACGMPGGFAYVDTSLWYARNETDLFRNLPGSQANYTDQDGVMRPADGALANLNTGDGCPIYTGAANPVNSPQRPVVLNRPFRSVAEMGYAFRDLPFSSLNFAPPNSATDSGDLGLLDLFCLNDTGDTVAGAVNINSAPAPVIQTLLSGMAEDDAVGGTHALTSANAATLAAGLITTTGTGLLTRADLAYPLSQAMQGAVFSSLEKANKSCREAPVRALASTADTRTWNFLIDVVAQSGRMAANAATPPVPSDFMVEGETRYWLHVAIDRYTGKVIGKMLEPVNE